MLTKEEGGRHTPFFNGYRPQFYFRTTDVTGVATLPEGVEMVMPGDNVEMTIELITPIAMEKELRFAIREGGRTVGAGVVAQDHRVTRPEGLKAKHEVREIITLACNDCKQRNYTYDEEQEDHARTAWSRKVLPLLPKAHRAQGDAAGREARGLERRPVAPTVEQRSPKPRVGGSNPSWPATFLRRRRRTDRGEDDQGAG